MLEDTKISAENKARNQLRNSRRVVVKVGTNLLLGNQEHPGPVQLKNIASQICELHRQNREVILVSSGAVGAGMKALGILNRPKSLPEIQMAASVGQTHLMAEYAKLFLENHIHIGQVLLTHDDLRNRVRHLNARNTFLTLLKNRVIPIVNENDVVSVNEIRVGDNDVLASLVALLVEADALVLATTADGFYETQGSEKKVLSFTEKVNEGHLAKAHGKGNSLSTGGMSTKLIAANNVAKMGSVAAIVNGQNDHYILDVLNGKSVGTVIGSGSKNKRAKKRKQWIAFFNRVQGSVVIDNGAKNALLQQHRSLLPIGVLLTKGAFGIGSLVQIEDSLGIPIARGFTEYSSMEIDAIKGLSLKEIANQWADRKDVGEVIHRDNIWTEDQD